MAAGSPEQAKPERLVLSLTTLTKAKVRPDSPNSWPTPDAEKPHVGSRIRINEPFRVQTESVGPGDAGVTEITPTFLRAEARWGVWEAALRIRVEEFAEDIGEELHPAEGASPLEILQPGSGRVDWAERLAVLALEYRSVVKGGVRNPGRGDSRANGYAHRDHPRMGASSAE